MSESSITSDLTPKRVGRLLRLYSDPEEEADSQSPEQQKSLLLTSFLSCTLPLNPEVLRELPVLMQQMYGQKPRADGKPLREMLLESKTSLSELEAVKELAKRKVKTAQSRAEREVAGVVYYAAIAAALTSHRERITKHSYRQLRESFESFLGKNWIPVDLTDLVKKAQGYCEENLSGE